MSEKPSVGRMVHYVSYGTPGDEYGWECRAAVVTEVGDVAPFPGTVIPSDSHAVSLAVLNPTGMFFNQDVPYGESESPDLGKSDLCTGVHHRGGTWHWPARTR